MERTVLHPGLKNDRRFSSLSFRGIWELEGDQNLSSQRTSDVFLLHLPGTSRMESSLPVYRKRYWYPGLKGKLKGFFRNTFFGRSRPASEFRNLKRLNDLGLSLVRPLAFGEERKIRVLQRAFILTSFFPGTLSLQAHLESEAFGSLSGSSRRFFLCALGRWVSALHCRGYRDRDLFARNILVHGEKAVRCFSKIDSPSGSGGRVPPGGAFPYLRDLNDLDRDLSRWLSRQDRLRMVLAYTGSGEVDIEVRRLIKRLVPRRA